MRSATDVARRLRRARAPKANRPLVYPADNSPSATGSLGSTNHAQLESLNRSKLSALARSTMVGPDVALTPVPFPGGAMLTTPKHTFAMLVGEPSGALGSALAKATPGTDVHLFLDKKMDEKAAEKNAAGGLARIAAGFSPSPTVWEVEGTSAERMPPSVAPVTPETRSVPDELTELLVGAGVEIVVEEGVTIGEVLGLEVARIGVDGLGEPRLQVGVGLYDQEAFATMNPNLPSTKGLEYVVGEVRNSRRSGAHPNQMNRLVRERWVRALMLAHPDLLGLTSLEAVPSMRPRNGLRDTVPAVAVGEDSGGRVVVVCSTGVDFSVVPAAVDAADRYGADRAILVVPARDQYRHLLRLVELAAIPITVVDAPEPWAAPAAE